MAERDQTRIARSQGLPPPRRSLRRAGHQHPRQYSATAPYLVAMSSVLEATNHMTSINADDASCHEARGMRRQQEQRAIEVFNATEPALGDAINETNTLFGCKEIAIEI